MSLEAWLASAIKREQSTALTAALLAGVTGLLLLLFTFGFAYGSIWFISRAFFSSSAMLALILTLAFVVALFIGNLKTSREYLESYSFTTGTASDEVVSFEIPLGGHGSNINPIAPDSAHSYLKMLVSILYTAPRLLRSANHNLKRGSRLADLDITGCAAILNTLLKSDRKVGMKDIAAANPKLPLGQLLPQLAELPGVLFLKAEPPGLSLTSDLRREIVSALS